ncbi:hypothetical protein EJB05_50279, partial [Eragrostis curvula]
MELILTADSLVAPSSEPERLPEASWRRPEKRRVVLRLPDLPDGAMAMKEQRGEEAGVKALKMSEARKNASDNEIYDLMSPSDIGAEDKGPEFYSHDTTQEGWGQGGVFTAVAGSSSSTTTSVWTAKYGGRPLLFLHGLSQEQWRQFYFGNGTDDSRLTLLDKSCDGEELPDCGRFVISADSWSNGRARVAFNNAVGDSFEMVTEQSLRYKVSVLKRSSETILKGGWSDFVEQHALQHGDSILMRYKPKMRSFSCLPFDTHGKERIPAMTEDALMSSIFVDEYNNMLLSGCSLTLRMSEFTENETRRLLNRLKSGKRITMKPLVHRLTATDVQKGVLVSNLLAVSILADIIVLVFSCSNLLCLQKLKKSVAVELNLKKSGTIQFQVPKEPCVHDLSYKIMTDGRVSCQWKEIVEEQRLAIGQLMVFAPTLEEDDPVVLLYAV